MVDGARARSDLLDGTSFRLSSPTQDERHLQILLSYKLAAEPYRRAYCGRPVIRNVIIPTKLVPRAYIPSNHRAADYFTRDRTVLRPLAK